MPNRSAKQQRNYDKHRDSKKSQPEVCDFCDINSSSEQFVSETKNFKVIRNIFPYSYWDHQRVSDHLMIVPKQHSNTLSSLSKDAALEFVMLISDYEKNGYNIYARASQSNIKSITHQHTHLIKPDGKKVIKTVIYRAKPYFRVIK